MTLALDEIASNVIRHGFGDGKEHVIAVTLEIADGLVTATVVDDGEPFDPHDAPAPNLDAPISDRKPGSLGIQLVKATWTR